MGFCGAIQSSQHMRQIVVVDGKCRRVVAEQLGTIDQDLAVRCHCLVPLPGFGEQVSEQCAYPDDLKRSVA